MATVAPRTPQPQADQRTDPRADQRPRPAGAHRKDDRSGSLGDLLSDLTTDVQKLFHQEVELAKAEVREEVTKTGKAAGMFGGAGFAGYMVIVFLSLAAMFGLAKVVYVGWAALIVTGMWALIAGTLYLMGRSRMRSVSPKPEQTVETLKEDAQWARHPTA